MRNILPLMISRAALSVLTILLAITLPAQVSLQTGAAEYRLPLFHIKDNKTGLGSFVSLNYVNGNGLKVDQNATNVGTGWDLDAGGFISRTVNGLPDDQKYWGSNTPSNPDVPYDHFGNSGYYPNGYLYSGISPSDAVPGFAAQVLNFNGTSFLKAPPKVAADRELDIFTFSCNGRAGQFYIGKDKSIVQTTNSKLAISFEEDNLTSQGIRTTIKKFIVKDENGFVYTFAEYEVNTLLKYAVTSQIGFNTNTGTQYSYGQEYASNIEANTNIISKWFLTSVTTPFTSEQVTYSYDAFSVDITDGAKHLTNQQVSDKTSIVLQTDRYKYTSKRLNTITLPDNQKLKFVYYDNVTRVDVPGDAPLKQIEYYITDQGTESRKSYYYFDQGYFDRSQIQALNYTFATSEKRFARLCLKSVQQFTNASQGMPPVSFEYNLGDANNNIGVPARYTFRKDWWGYYSYLGETGLHPMELTDGTIATDYAFWGISNPITRDAAALGCLTKIKNNTGGTQEFQYEQNMAAESTLESKMSPGVRVKKYILSDGLGNAKTTEYKYIKADATTSGIGYETPLLTTSSKLRIYKNTNGLTAHLFQIAAYSILSMNASSKSQFTFRSERPRFDISTSLKEQINGIAIQFFISVLTYLFQPDYMDYDVTVHSYDNMNLANPLPVIYSRIEVTESGNTISSGKTVYDLNSYSDYTILNSTYAFPFSAKMRYKPWLYGAPKKIQYHDGSNTLLREVINTYAEVTQSISSNNFLSKKWGVNTVASVKWDNDPYNISNTFVTSEDYSPVTGRLELTNTVEKTYDKNSNVSVKNTNYYYNTGNYQLNKTETYINSNEVYGRNIYYNSDFDGSVNLTSQLTSKNIINVPVLTADWKKISGTQYLLSAGASKFSQTDDGSIKITEEYNMEISAPATGTFLSSFNSSVAPYSNTGFVSQKTINYLSGIITQTSDRGGNAAVIMNQNGREVIAKVANAFYADIAYTSFEGTGNGNWSYTVNAVVGGASKTGKRYYTLSGNNITTSQSLTSSITYIVTLWAKSGSVTINGSSPSLLLSDADGWNLYQSEISGTTSITITGNAQLDELRLYPKRALMTTYAYEPYIGISAVCDANNRISYHEYDDFGRVALIRDHQKNILKYYCYKYQGYDNQPCYGEFANAAASQVFYRNNCTGAGTAVTYTVPLGKYHSYISQADADAKAAQEISSNGQNYANTNGACFVYAKLFYENVSYSYSYTIGDVVIRFFSDAACTNPVSVSNLSINWKAIDNCNNGYGIGSTSTTANGVSLVVGSSTTLSYEYFPNYNDPDSITCAIIYSLLTGSGYVISQ